MAEVTPQQVDIVINKPSYIESANKKYRFVIMDAPSDENIVNYIEVLKKRSVSALVRACEPKYDTAPVTDAGIIHLDLPFLDGEPPPDKIIDRWLDLVDNEFSGKNGKTNTIAVHCVAGLGRAPLLVAIALVEGGMEPIDAVNFIRKRRRGAINSKQLKWIESYKCRRARSCCIVS